MQGDLQGNKLLYLLVSMFLILSGMIQKVMAIIDLSTYRLREEMPLDAEPIENVSKYFTDEVTDIICEETNRNAEQYIEANAANLRPKSVVPDWKPTYSVV